MARAAPVPVMLGHRNVLWLLLSFALVALPHSEHLPVWETLLASAVVYWRWYLSRHGLALPRKLLLLAVAAGAMIGVYASYGGIFGRDAGVALLVAMLSFKLLEMSTLRDAMVIVLLCYFGVLTNFLYSQTIPTAALMLAAVLVTTTTTIGLQHTSPGNRDRDNLLLAGTILAQAVPLMLLFFLLFPRVPGPLWGVPQDAYAGISGLSDSMTPGALSRLGLSDAVAFRVAFESPIPKPSAMYWRGPVLWYFDGTTWHAGLSFDTNPPSFVPESAPVKYTVTIEPHNRRWLFALDLPAKLPPNSRATADFQLLAATPVRNRMRYEMASNLVYRASPEGLSAFERRRALQLPERVNWRSRALADSMRKAARDDKEMLRNVLSMFRTQDFYYTLTPPLLGPDSVDDFLFNTKRGFCEHFASSFVFLMRAAGIPARVVTGYQGGELNPVGNYVVVRQADAHAWAEVWIEGEGWIRVDPTAAVSPLRVEAGIAAAVAANEPLPLLVRADYQWLRELQFTWDSMSNSWNQWVLGYTPERQVELLAKIGFDLATPQNLVATLFVATGAILLGFGLVMLRRLGVRPNDPVMLAYRRFCRKLERTGAPRRPSEGPVDYAARLERLRPELATPVRAITELYVGLRYGDVSDRDRVRELQRRVAEFRA
ncbi:MAG TPA: DUF3488 and transglutaminase-like domain-containing protein [Burkholderiales bacterium]|nr:DUF3488 and transglutaminase-like domain-containing protein [Burkholderiales bacterium]